MCATQWTDHWTEADKIKTKQEIKDGKPITLKQMHPASAKCIKHLENDPGKWCVYETKYENLPTIKFIDEGISKLNPPKSLQEVNLHELLLNMLNDEDVTKEIKAERLKAIYSEMENRILTISMAGQKAFAPNGGYIILTVEEDLYRGGKSNKKKSIKKKNNKKLLNYMPFSGK